MHRECFTNKWDSLYPSKSQGFFFYLFQVHVHGIGGPENDGVTVGRWKVVDKTK